MKQLAIINQKIQLIESVIPEQSADYQLIKVQAAGLNRADLLQLKGVYPSPDGNNILGLEISGVEVASGKKVCALLTSGGFSQYVMVHESMITPMPNGMSFEEAAALPEALLTVYLNLFKLGGLQKGQSVLVHGGSSGVGSFAISLLKANGNRVFATASSEEKIRFCRNLGADFVFSYQDNYANSIIEMGGVDLVLDMFGGEHTANSMRCLRFAGKLICIAASQGRVVNIDLAMVLKNNLQIQGSTLRNKSLQEKAELTHAAMQLYGELAMPKPTIDSVYELADYEKAFAKLMERRQMGKIVLKM